MGALGSTSRSRLDATSPDVDPEMPRSPVLSGPGFGIVAPEGAVDPGDDAHIAPTRFEARHLGDGAIRMTLKTVVRLLTCCGYCPS